MNRFILISVYLLGFPNLSALSLPNAVYRSLTEKEDLSGNAVHYIYQDQQGLLWISTANGLNIFDANNVETFAYITADSVSLKKNTIYFIAEDSVPHLWLGTSQGLFLFDRDRHRFEKVNIYLKGKLMDHQPVICFVQNRKGMYFATEHAIYRCRGVESIQKNKALSLKVANRYLFKDILSLAVRNDSCIWIGTMGKGLYSALIDRNDAFHIAREDLGNPYNNISIHQMISRGHVLLFTTENNEVFAYSSSFDEPLKRIMIKKGENRSVSTTQLMAMTEDEYGTIWLGSDKGLFYINPPAYSSIEEYTQFPGKTNSAIDRKINCIFSDHQGDLWIGTNKGLMNLFENPNAISFGKQTLTSNDPKCEQCNDVLSFVKDDHKNLWVGTDGSGLFVFDKSGNLIRHLSTENNFPDDVILALHIDKDNRLWIGTYRHGAVIYDLSNDEYHQLPDIARKKSDNTYYDIRDFAEDKKGNLWLATNGGGLIRYDLNTGKHISYRKGEDNPKNIISDYVVKLFFDHAGTLWIGTYEGLSIFNAPSGTFTSFQSQRRDSSSISNNWVYAICEDNDHNIWVGTESGLNEFIAGGRFKRFYTEQGLPGNQVGCIQTDSKGYLWISTNDGLTRFNTKKEKFINFQQEEGLQGKQFIHGSSYRDAKGKLFFGGIEGFNQFYPDSIRINNYIPNIILTKFMVNNVEMVPGAKGSPLSKYVNLTKEIWLNHDQNSFSVEFSALNYIRSGENQYAYKLEGFDKSWNYLKTNHPAIYTNMDPGTYVFRVIGSNDYGIWNRHGKKLIIHIRPAWWSTWWMKLLVVVICIVLLYFFRKYTIITVTMKNKLWLDHEQKQRSEELNRMKIQFFTNISHELRTPLSLIVGPLERMSRSGSDSDELKIVRKNVNRLKNMVDQILDFRRIESEDLPLHMSDIEAVSCIRDVVWNFKDIADQKDINLIFHSDIPTLHVMLDEDKTYKILSNLLSNAVKFTPNGGTVEVSVSQELNNTENKRYLIIQVLDSGKGISDQEKKRIFDLFYSSGSSARISGGTGIGLYLARKLTEMQHGKIIVDSPQETGTRFTVFLPIGKQSDIIPNKQVISHEVVNRVNENTYTGVTIVYNDNEVAKTVMVIDDNSEICDYLMRLLRPEFHVIKESDSKKAMDILLKNMPDMVISDVMMPEIDGMEICRMIKADIRLSHIPVILLTAKATVEDQIKGLNIGADEYIYKPFDDELLLSRIRNLIRQRDQLRTYFLGADGRLESGTNINRIDKVFIDQVMNIIRENYQSAGFNVNSIVEKMGMSRSVFYKKIKSLSTESINDLIKSFRLKRAGELLVMDRLTVSEAAYNTGFSDPAYFSKVFKEHYKVSPKDYVANPKLQSLN